MRRLLLFSIRVERVNQKIDQLFWYEQLPLNWSVGSSDNVWSHIKMQQTAHQSNPNSRKSSRREMLGAKSKEDYEFVRMLYRSDDHGVTALSESPERRSARIKTCKTSGYVLWIPVEWFLNSINSPDYVLSPWSCVIVWTNILSVKILNKYTDVKIFCKSLEIS